MSKETIEESIDSKQDLDDMQNLHDIQKDIENDENNEKELEDVEVIDAEDEEDDMGKKLKEKEKQINDYVDKLQRTMAEFDNFRKRTVKEKAVMYEKGEKDTLEKLLPIVDNFERALASVPEDEKESPVAQGVEMIFKQLLSTLTELGVKEIDAQGKEFDPNFHHAVTHADDDEYDDNIVSEVFQKGYMFNDNVLRHSMVKVVN